MSRRRSKRADGALGVLILFGFAAWIISSAYDSIKSVMPPLDSLVGVLLLSGAPALIVGAYIAQNLFERRRKQREAVESAAAVERRRQFLLERYGDTHIVQAIMAGHIWHDMSKDQLIDSWGHPEDVAVKVMRSKVKETYKYGRTGINRFSRRAYLENDLVIGWEE